MLQVAHTKWPKIYFYLLFVSYVTMLCGICDKYLEDDILYLFSFRDDLSGE